jgi:hypothetical protein
VDLSVPKLEILWGGKPVSIARVQLIATHLAEKQDWLWGFHNPSIVEAGFRELRAKMEELSDLTDLLKGKAFSVDGDRAFDLADWIAYRAGYEAMYPARVKDATAFLALSFTEHRGKPASPNAPWCIGCGQLAEELKVKLVAGPDGRSLCEDCARNPLDILEEKQLDRPDLVAESEAHEPIDAPLADVLRAFCDRRRPRLMMPETAICWVCLETLRKALRS